jgi:hypothetical protein
MNPNELPKPESNLDSPTSPREENLVEENLVEENLSFKPEEILTVEYVLEEPKSMGNSPTQISSQSQSEYPEYPEYKEDTENTDVTLPSWLNNEQRIAELKNQEEKLKVEIANLQNTYNILQTQVTDTQLAMGKLVQESLSQLEQRKQTLQLSIEQLERRQERIKNEMKTSFAGASQDLAIRVQGFKDYLTGSLQDLATAAEQLQLVPTPLDVERLEIRQGRQKERPKDRQVERDTERRPEGEPLNLSFAQQQFQETTKQIRRFIDQYRTKPDYYGPAWQLRRTFEPVHAERVSNWFFNQGGRGALKTMGSRMQNILVASAVISILYELHGDRSRTLVLSNTPERLGEWRRGLQDCLGIGRPDFGPDRGIVLFESAEPLAQKAERLVKSNQIPIIIIDDSEEQVSLSLLQFPLWLAFAPDPKMSRNDDYDF